MKRSRQQTPRILTAADLVHLNKEQRLALLGGERNWVRRHDILKKALGTAAIITLTAGMFSACKEAPPACAADGSCSSQGGRPPTTTPEESVLPIISSITVVNSAGTQTLATIARPSSGISVDLEELYLRREYHLKVSFDKLLTWASSENDRYRKSWSITPEPWENMMESIDSEQGTNYLLYFLEFEETTTYTFTLHGTSFKDSKGNLLDADGDRVAGGDFVCYLNVKKLVEPPPPTCATHGSCSCDSQTPCAANCSCYDYHAPCGCQTYRL